MKRRTFTARYKPSVMFVSAPALVAAPLVAIAVYVALNSLPGALAAGSLSVILATVLSSAHRRARPALLLSQDGVSIEGLTPVAWSALDRVRLLQPFLPSQAPALELRFTREDGWPTGVRAVSVSPLWRPLKDGLFLRVGLLEDAPEAIKDAFEHFLKQRGAAG